MWDDLLSRFGSFCKNLVILSERVDRQTTELKDLREEVKTLSEVIVDLKLEMVRLQNECRMVTQQQENEERLSTQRFQAFKLEVELLLERLNRPTQPQVREHNDPPRLTE